MTAKNQTLTEKIQTLDHQIEWFYSDDFSLDHAADNYKKSIALAKDIEQDLKTLKNDIEILSQDFSS